MIKKGSVSKIQISEKLTKKIAEIIINASKRKFSKLQISNMIKLHAKSILSHNKDQLQGGGSCCSMPGITEDDFNQIKEIDETQINNHQNKEFENIHKKWTDSQTMSQIIEKGEQLKVQKYLLKQCILDQIIHSEDLINTYQSEIQDIFETFLMLEVTRDSNKQSESKKDEFDEMFQKVISIEQYEQDFPIKELVFYTKMLRNLNKVSIQFDKNQQNEIIKLKELVNRILKFNKNADFTAIQSNINAINYNIFENKELFLLKFQIEIWMRKINQFGEKFLIISEEQEILFYVKYFFEINKLQNSQDEIILTLIRINYILEKFQKENSQNNNKTQIYQQFRNVLIKANIEQFFNELMQNSDQFNNQLFLIFSIENQDYRYITLSILFTFNSIFTFSFEKIQRNQEYLLDFLCNKYLTESEQAIRVIFEKSNEFIKYFNQNIKTESFKQKMITIDKLRKQKLLPLVAQLGNYEKSLNSFEDIIKLISDNAIRKWERDIKKRQRQNISQKDDVLLEVKDLYINQMITYLKGNSIFQKSKQSYYNQNQDLIHQQNALQDILKLFLNPDYSYRLKCINNKSIENDGGEIAFNNQSNQCQILGILAEGGTGKSMFMKKIETLLIENLTKLNTETETGNYLPILVKCNSLDPKNPSLDDYLRQQGINEDTLQSLKSNERYKLILLDGYDEYTGDYFVVFSTLKIKDWKNTKIIIATRKEKLSESDACAYFSKQNELGQRDEMSYTLVRLEEFTSKDIHEYAERYFKQERKADQINLIEKDLKNLRDCLTNGELEKLLHLPINLYLLTRMLVNLNDKEIQNLKSNVSDSIGIQEIFFNDQFKREAQSFIDAHIDSNSLKRDEEFKSSIKNCYFDYFQTIAMLMFKNRGVVLGNYLQVEKKQINFNISQSVTQILSKSSLINSLMDKIINYINSKIITRVKSEQQHKVIQSTENQQKFIEFKHKSLYEYFAARAMQNDFDVHGENIYNLKMEELEQFKINQKSIMNIGQNQSEQQILIKLYKFIKNQVESEEFRNNYYEKLIEKNNKYIQFLKRSQIQTNTEISKIDVGASNLISALFISKFSYSKLKLSLCSFSKAYISTPKSREINFDRCNLEYAYLQNTDINFDSCNTQSAIFNAFSKIFDTDNIKSFNKLLWGKSNLLYSISNSGYINVFKTTNLGIQLIKSKQLSQQPLYDIQFAHDNHFLVSSKYTLFLINSNNFEIYQTHKFILPISNITQIEENIAVVLENQTLHTGTFQDGFQQSNNFGCVRGSVYNQTKKNLVTYQNESFSLWKVIQNPVLIQTIKKHTKNIIFVAFSENRKYLATVSDDKICKIWNAEKEFELINTIQEPIKKINNIVSFDQQKDKFHGIISVTFSADGKYLAISFDNRTCKIWNIEKGFELINEIQGNTEQINSFAFSTDGKFFASGSDYKICKIWNVEKNFELINTIQGHNNFVFAFSKDGKYLATGSSDTTCKIWNANEGFEFIKLIQGHKESVCSVAFSADGKYLATGSSDTTCKIWNAWNDFEIINTIYGHTETIYSITFSADGKYLASGSGDKTCKIWNATNGFELINTIQGHTNVIVSVDFSADGKYLATGSGDGTCKIWNTEKDFQIIYTIKGHSLQIECIAFSADGKYIATGSLDKNCKIWNVEKGYELINILQHTEYISSVAFSADGKYLATNQQTACKIWNIEKGFELINTILEVGGGKCSFIFFADAEYLATGGQSCKIWDIDKGYEFINTIKGHTESIISVAYSVDGKYLATSSSDTTCKIWNAEKGFDLINTIKGHTDRILSMAFSTDGKYLSTFSNDTFKIWNVEKDFELINTIQEIYQNNNWIFSVAFSTDGKYFAAGSDTCKIWNVEKNFELIKTIQVSNVQCLAFSIDRKYLTTGTGNSSSGILSIWNIEKNFELIKTIQVHSSLIHSVAFSADGKYLATGSQDTTCKIWNIEKGFDLIYTIKGHTDNIVSVAFSADGKYLATGSWDKSCKIWNVKKDFEVINTIEGHSSWINSVAFSANGKYLVTCSSDITCKIWNVEKGFDLINKIQGYTESTNSVAFSADRKYLVTSHDNKTCKIWNVEKDFELINTIQGHTEPINLIDFSADGKYLVTSSSDRTCKIWSTEKGFQLKLTMDQIFKIEFSRDHKYIFIEQINKQCKIYDLSNLEILKEQGQDIYQKVKEKYQFQSIKIVDIQKLNLFENLYVL